MARLKAVIDRLENNKMVLRFAKGQQLIIDKIKGVKEGDVICLTLAVAKKETKKRTLQAKKLLNKILKTSA